MVAVCGWHLHRHHRGPQFLIDTTNTEWVLFHGHGHESLPPPAPPLRAMRRVNDNGRVTVAGQRLRVGRTYAGQTVLIAIEDAVFRVLLNGAELTTHARRTDQPITRFKGHPRRQKPSPEATFAVRQTCPNHQASSMS